MAIQQKYNTKMDEKQLIRAAKYVAMQCTGCSESPNILTYKAYDVMLEAVEKGENPYVDLNIFLGTCVLEYLLRKL